MRTFKLKQGLQHPKSNAQQNKHQVTLKYRITSVKIFKKQIIMSLKIMNCHMYHHKFSTLIIKWKKYIF